MSGRFVEDLTNCYRSAVDEYSQRRAWVGGLQICSLHSAVASPTDNTPCQRVSIWPKTLMTIMERQLKGGRKAHGRNGRNTQSCKLTSKRIEEDSFDEVLQSKPNGSCKMEGCNKTGQKSELNICTYNVRTLRTEESLESLLDELEGFKWDVIGLAETKRRGEGLTELKGGTWLYNRGKTEDDKNAKGIGFLIHNKFKDYVKEVKSYSNRVAAMKIQLTGKDEMCIIQVYAPTSDYDDITVEEFYEDINKAITDNSGTYTVLMGDFNAKIGQREKGEENIMGSFSYGERNRRGERMIEFAMEHKLKVTNTYFKKHKSRYWTWESPNGVTKNQIDFILSNQRGIVKNCEVITNVDIASDHRMVRVNISINKKLARLRFIQNKRKTRINIMKLKGKKEEFQLKLHNRFDGLELEDMDIDERCDMVTSAMLEEAKYVAPTEKRKIVRSEEDKEIEELDQRRKEIRLKESKTTTEKVEYAEIVKLVKKKRRQRNRRKTSKLILETLESGRGPKTIQKMASKKSRMSKLKKKDGNITSDRSELLEICADFYQELYGSTKKQPKDHIDISSRKSDIPPILQREVEEAVNSMKDNKAPGNDEITSDIIKQGGEETITQLLKLFNQILEKQQIPTTWKEAKIILLYKKGDKADVKNYRPISLLSHLYKIFTKVIQNRIKDRLDSNQPREQAGFRAGFSTTDHLQAINQLIEKANEYQLQLCLGFVDYQKAFDSIEHTDMFDALRKINIEEGYVRILEDIYNNAVARIHIDNDVSREVKIQRGVRQGDTLSPKIFTATIEEVFKKSHLNGGINIDGETLTDLRFADDVALISTSTKDLEDQLTGLNRESKVVLA